MTDTAFSPEDMATASAQGFRDGVASERTRCTQALRDTLTTWRCVPSQHLREFVELAIAKMEKDQQ